MEIKIGAVLYGFCNGIFGNKYITEAKRIEAMGNDWVVVRSMKSGVPLFAKFAEGWNKNDMLEMLALFVEDKIAVNA